MQRVRTWKATIVETASRLDAVLDVVAVAGAVMLGAWIRIPLPFTPAPITLQTLPVLMAGTAVGTRRASAGMLLYVCLGLLCAPVFAGPLTVTCGYVAAFMLTPWLMKRINSPGLAILAATLLIYALGATWLCLSVGLTPVQAIVAGVLPFVPGDCLKALVAYSLIRRMRKIEA